MASSQNSGSDSSSYAEVIKGSPPSESRFFSKNSIFQKAHILVALNVLFQNMYKAYMNRAYLTQFWRDYLKP
jgi:hypothetical protein